MKPIETEQPGSTHYVVVADRVHLRIFQETSEPGQKNPALRLVAALDLPGGRGRVGTRVSDEAGRFPRGSATKRGGIDEHLPMYEEAQKRVCEDLGRRLSEFFRARPHATWDVAIAEPIFHQVLDQVEAGPRTRIRRAVAKDLANQPAGRLRAQFGSAQAVVV